MENPYQRRDSGIPMRKNHESSHRSPLPVQLDEDGRPVWEPPIFDYSGLIGDEYVKKREAALKYTKGDVVKTTVILDMNTETYLLSRYLEWAGHSWNDSSDEETEVFFEGLWQELFEDWKDVINEQETVYNLSEITFERQEDGTYVAMESLERVCKEQRQRLSRTISNMARPPRFDDRTRWHRPIIRAVE